MTAMLAGKGRGPFMSDPTINRVAAPWFWRPRSRRPVTRWFALAPAALCCASLATAHADELMAAVFLASLAGSIAGFAFSAICGAMLFHLDHAQVHLVQIMITCSIASQTAMTWATRREIDWRVLGVFVAGGAVGLPFGAWLLLNTKPAGYTETLGIFLLLYGGYMLIRRPFVIGRQHPAFNAISGAFGGVTGGALGAPGIPVTIWCSIKGWDKARQRGLFQAYILAMQVLTLLVISLPKPSGARTSGYDVSDVLFVPASLLGTSFGMLLYRRLSDTQFALIHELNRLLALTPST